VPTVPVSPLRPPQDEHDEHVNPRKISPVRILLAVGGGAGIVALLFLRSSATAAGFALPNRLQDLLTLSISVIIESLPFVVLGILLSIVVQIWLPDGALERFLPSNPFLRRAGISLFGVFLPVCECGNLPLARGLILKGFSVPEAMTFLLAAPIVNPITIVTTYQAFGWSNGILISRVIGGFVIANVIGWVFSRHPQPESLLTPKFVAECVASERHTHAHSRWSQSVDAFVREASVIMPALFIGALLAGGIQVLVPRAVLINLGTNPIWSIVAMMVLAFVIAVCSNVDAFFILPFASTFLPGSIVTFLVFGPMIDIKMLTMMRTTFTTRVLVQLTVLVGLLSALLGLVVNYVV